MATFGAANGLLPAGDFDITQAELELVTVPTTTGTADQLDGMLALSRSLVAAADKRLSNVDAPLEYAADLATRTGEGNAYWLGFGPTNVGVWRMGVALKRGTSPRPPVSPKVYNPACSPPPLGKRLTGPTTAARWPGFGDATTTP